MTCATDRGSISMIFISPQMRTLVSITRGTLWSGAGLPPCIPIFMEEQWDCSPCQIRHSCGPLICPHISIHSISIQFGREKTNNNNKRSSQDWVFKCKRERKGSACLHIVMCKFLPLMVWVLGCAHGGISTSITISVSVLAGRNQVDALPTILVTTLKGKVFSPGSFDTGYFFSH